MKALKEILIQEVNIAEINYFEKFIVDRCDQTFGTPIYFAPYYTRGTKELEGISNLAKVVGIFTLKPVNIDNFTSDLEVFSNDPEQVIQQN
jgi:hypothetical protein